MVSEQAKPFPSYVFMVPLGRFQQRNILRIGGCQEKFIDRMDGYYFFNHGAPHVGPRRARSSAISSLQIEIRRRQPERVLSFEREHFGKIRALR